MRLHRLHVSAFGPFAQSQVIDFDELSGAGLFLVHGATGAGKTSILDAVCFALFADVPGARSARALRSDLAPPDLLTSVTLEFTASGRRLRVTRSPEQVRPKRRGTGSVKAVASVVLEEFAHGWQVRSTRIDEAAEVIADAVGLGLAQFQRIALLPQGEFSAFLRADARDRHRLLTALFDVTAFEDVEAWLAEKRREHASAREAAERDFGYAVRSLVDLLSGLPGEAVDLPALLGDRDISDLAATEWAAVTPILSEQLSGAAVETNARASEAITAADGCQRELAQAETLVRARRRGEAAQQETAELASHASAIAEARERLAASARAERVRPHLHAADVAGSAHRRAAAALAQAGASLSSLSTSLDPADLLAEEAVDRGTRLLAAAQAPARDLAKTAAEVTEAERSYRDLGRRAEALASQQDQRHQQIADLDRALASDETEREPLAEAIARHTVIAQAVQLSGVLTSARDAETAGREESLAAERAELSAQRQLLDLEQARLADLAAQLADGLIPGAPCPVCGSAEHPEPAQIGADWSPDAIAQAEAALAARRREMQRINSTLAVVSERIASATSRLAELGHADHSPAELASKLRQCGGQVESARQQVREREAQQRALADARHTQEQAAATLRQAAIDAELAKAATRDLRDRLQQSVDRVRALLTDHADCPCQPSDPVVTNLEALDHPGLVRELTRSHDHHDQVIREVSAVRSARERQAATADALQAADTDLLAALPETGFADREEARRALLPDNESQALEASIHEHERRGHLATATLAEPDIIAALAAPTPNLDALKQAAAHQRAQAQNLSRSAHDLDRIATSSTTLLARIGAAAKLLEREREAHLRVSALAELTGGTSPENTLRMRLSTFVLAARLERVVELANERLAVMGEGRFRLGHDDSLAAHGARSGLGLLIRDEWSGVDRSPASLSGGESFMASVALALGLADAVRESAGGVELQTLFIDEGFGSLDEHSLEDVMAVLDGLRDGGRAVGVVSHLAELRDRIPTQLAVHKSSAGSHVEQNGNSALSA